MNKALDYVGTATGFIGLIGSGNQVLNNPSAGNVLKASFDGGVFLAGIFAPYLYIAKPIFGIAAGVWGVSGSKDAFFKAIDN